MAIPPISCAYALEHTQGPASHRALAFEVIHALIGRTLHLDGVNITGFVNP